jgi:hypothetical protein
MGEEKWEKGRSKRRLNEKVRRKKERRGSIRG